MSFEFQKESILYIVYNSTNYKLHASTFDFNQTFKQDSYETKTLHSPTSLFEGSSINTANPANFSFTIPMLDETSTHQHIPLQLIQILIFSI